MAVQELSTHSNKDLTQDKEAPLPALSEGEISFSKLTSLGLLVASLLPASSSAVELNSLPRWLPGKSVNEISGQELISLSVQTNHSSLTIRASGLEYFEISNSHGFFTLDDNLKNWNFTSVSAPADALGLKSSRLSNDGSSLIGTSEFFVPDPSQLCFLESQTLATSWSLSTLVPKSMPESYSFDFKFEKFAPVAANSNLVVGTASSFCEQRSAPFIWAVDGSIQYLTPTNSFANGIAAGMSDTGLIVGSVGSDIIIAEEQVFFIGDRKAAVWKPGVGFELLPALGASQSECLAISPNGKFIAGNLEGHLVRWDFNGSSWEDPFIIDIDNFPVTVRNVPTRVTDSGWVVGYSEDEFLVRNGFIVDSSAEMKDAAAFVQAYGVATSGVTEVRDALEINGALFMLLRADNESGVLVLDPEKSPHDHNFRAQITAEIGGLKISWPSSLQASLEVSSGLSSAWTPVNIAPTIEGENRVVHFSNSQANSAFFRLKKQ